KSKPKLQIALIFLQISCLTFLPNRHIVRAPFQVASISQPGALPPSVYRNSCEPLHWRCRMRFLLLTSMLLACLGFGNCNNQWVTPPDTSAANLDAKAIVLDFPTSSDGKNVVVLQFRSNGKAVKFAGGETVTCNGVNLPLNELMFGYAERVPIVAVGGTYHFV